MMSSKRPWVSLLFLVLVLCAACGSSQEVTSAVEPEPEPAQPQGRPFAVIETDKGEITVELDPEIAPRTVENFIELAEVGFYSQTSFHRVIKDRMIQGGDPYSRDRDPYNDGQGTSGTYLPQEFSSVQFERGTIAMGRTPGADDGGSCQFFIVLKRSPEWDGQYNAFGKVVEGIEVADKISQSPLVKDPHPSMKGRPAGKHVIKGVRIEYRK